MVEMCGRASSRICLACSSSASSSVLMSAPIEASASATFCEPPSRKLTFCFEYLGSRAKPSARSLGDSLTMSVRQYQLVMP